MKEENENKYGKTRHYFPGGNTSEGFYSFYDNILRTSSTGKTAIIKGGPGTGKSSLMKKIGKHFEDEGEYVHYLHCSSDCNSLDGVYLPKYNSAVIDGTSPHTVDCRYPGAYDRIFDAGIFINENIAKYDEEIKKVDTALKSHFSSAYEYLRVAKSISDIMQRRSADSLDFGEVNNFCFNVSKRAVNPNDNSKIRKMFLSGITPQGLKNYIDTIAYDKYVIKLECNVGDNTDLIMKKVLSYCQNQNTDIDVFYCPLKPHSPEHIVFLNSHLILTVSNKFHSTQYSDEIKYFGDFVKKEYDNSKEADDYEKYINSAVAELKKAKKLHDELELYYINNFDYNGLDCFTDKIIKFMKN